MIVSITYFIVVPILAFGVYIYYKNYFWNVKNEKMYLDRFHVFATELHLYKPYDEIEEDEQFTSDPTLRRLMGKDNENKTEFKKVSSRVVIDFQEVVSISEWSTSRYEDQKIVSDSTMLYMRNGDQILVLENFEIVIGALEIYLGKRNGR